MQLTQRELAMAKKKAAIKKTTSQAAAKPAPKNNVNPDSLDRSCCPDDIGHVAGEIWHRLDSGGHQSITQLKKSISAPADVVMAAVGWLAREDKVEFSKSGRAVKVGLR